MIGSSLSAPNKATHYIPVMNLTDATRTLHEGTRLEDVFPVESLKQVHEMLWVDSDFCDWDSDDEALMDVRGASVASAKKPQVNIRDDARMDAQRLTRVYAASPGVNSRIYLYLRA